MLTFNLKKEWFDKIKSGEKTHEYRVVSDYWQKRLEYHEGGEKIFDKKFADFYITKEKGIKEGSKIKFACGYPSENDKDRHLFAKVKNISIRNGKETDLKIDKPVYDIEFELIKELELKRTARGFAYYEFKDDNGEECSLQKSSSALEDKIWLGIDNAKIMEFYPAPRETNESWLEISKEEVETKLKHRPQNEIHYKNQRMHLSREQVKELLPILQRFVDTGEID